MIFKRKCRICKEKKPYKECKNQISVKAADGEMTIKNVCDECSRFFEMSSLILSQEQDEDDADTL